MERRIAEREAKVKAHVAEVAKREARTADVREKIQTARQKLANETKPARRATLEAEIRSRTRTLGGIENALRNHRRLRRNKERLLRKQRQELARLRAAELSPAQLQKLAADGQLPSARARINGRTAH
jgi:predicted  nucleic acid-binding Zn-ribbon protein